MLLPPRASSCSRTSSTGPGAGFAGVDHTTRLASLEVPTLIVWGDQDSIFSRESQEHLAATLPQATLEVYAETGHALHWERPGRFADSLETFLGETASHR